MTISWKRERNPDGYSAKLNNNNSVRIAHHKRSGGKVRRWDWRIENDNGNFLAGGSEFTLADAKKHITWKNNDYAIGVLTRPSHMVEMQIIIADLTQENGRD
jgi:hypothetical protein